MSIEPLLAGTEADTITTYVRSYHTGQSVARFPNAAARIAAIPSPVLNQLTSLDTAPGSVDCWNGSTWQTLQGGGGGGGTDPSAVPAALYDANSILKADADDTPTALVIAPSSFVGRPPTGGITAMDATTAKSTLSIASADVADLGPIATKTAIVNADIQVGANIDLTKLALNPLTRANHTGTQVAATISDFDTQVRVSRLDQFGAPTAALSMNNQRLTTVATPTSPTDAVNKTYVDTMAAGLQAHQAVRAAASVNVNIASPGASIDGIAPAANDRLLLMGQTDPTQNGIYVWTASATAMNRAADADTSAEVVSGMYVYAATGTLNGSKGWVLITPNPITLGTTSLQFTQYSGTGGMTGTANRVTVTGTQVDIAATYVGQASITTLGTITTGTWTGTAIAIANGGTGATTAAQAKINLGITTTPVPKFTQVIGNGTLGPYTVTHNFNTKDVQVELYEVSTGQTVYADVSRTTVNAISIAFSGPVATNSLTVVVMA